jgi:protein involved in polysaccharide export with SLBB domain
MMPLIMNNISKFARGTKMNEIMKILKLTMTGILLLSLGACVTTGGGPSPGVSHSVDDPASEAGVSSHDVSVQEQEYRIHVGDQLEIKFYYNPELNEAVIVRPDGRISMQLVHEIRVAGMTPAELSGLLAKKYADEIKTPEITVIVRSFSAQKVHVGGEVSNPGILDLIGTMTVLQAVSSSGGFLDTARTEDVMVIRRNANNKPLVLSVNLKKVIDGSDVQQDVTLMPSDLVYVPKSQIANVNQWVNQYIRKNIPVPFSIGYDLR